MDVLLVGRRQRSSICKYLNLEPNFTFKPQYFWTTEYILYFIRMQPLEGAWGVLSRVSI